MSIFDPALSAGVHIEPAQASSPDVWRGRPHSIPEAKYILSVNFFRDWGKIISKFFDEREVREIKRRELQYIGIHTFWSHDSESDQNCSL